MDGFIPSFPFQNSERSAKEPGRDRQALWEVRICKVQEASRSKGFSVLRRKKKICMSSTKVIHYGKHSAIIQAF